MASDSSVPSLDFLEFLAESRELDKQWVDPLSLKEMEDGDKAAGNSSQPANPQKVKQP